MILVDTPVWIDHFQFKEPDLEKLLESELVLSHSFVIGELACGNFKNRAGVLEYLNNLPTAPVAEDEEVFRLIEGLKLFGKGIGWIDVHILASSLLSGERLWTKDQRLQSIADALGVGWSPK